MDNETLKSLVQNGTEIRVGDMVIPLSLYEVDDSSMSPSYTSFMEDFAGRRHEVKRVYDDGDGTCYSLSNGYEYRAEWVVKS